MDDTKSIILKTFNKQLFAFIDDIIEVLDDKEIRTSRKYLETVKFAKPSLIIQLWFAYIEKPYHEEIEKGDPTFFLEKDYSNDLTYMENGKEIMETINTSLREPLRKMDDTNKEHCCSYIKVLSRLSKAYAELV